MSVLDFVFPSLSPALIEGRIDGRMARWVRPWTLVAWIFLTSASRWLVLGLLRTRLGRWWFWDPVENASLMPWLRRHRLAALLVVMEKAQMRSRYGPSCSRSCLLAVAARHLSGAFGRAHVRGMPSRPIRPAAFHPADTCGIFIGGSLLLYAWRASALKQGVCSRDLA